MCPGSADGKCIGQRSSAYRNRLGSSAGRLHRMEWGFFFWDIHNLTLLNIIQKCVGLF